MKKTISVMLSMVLVLVATLLLWKSFQPAPVPSVQTPVATNNMEPDTASRLRIVAFGDSLTAGYNLPIDQAYPAVLERSLVARDWSVEVINSGVSGETSAGGLRRAEFIRSLDPDIVLFGLGGNDVLRLLSPVELEKNLAQALEILLSGDRPPRILLIGMRAPANADMVYRKAFDAVYPRLAERYELPLIPFFLEGVALDPQYTLGDGIHPNVAGYERIVEETIRPVIEPLLESLIGMPSPRGE